ncbi:hypothetical protein V8G54_008574 [Vigna mungo]|uniref:Uncharacterized protein n=1 Tax=Vigna mungo TaxID=3915 RepID=A0AAQ3P5V0_VIGMU
MLLKAFIVLLTTSRSCKYSSAPSTRHLSASPSFLDILAFCSSDRSFSSTMASNNWKNKTVISNSRNLNETGPIKQKQTNKDLSKHLRSWISLCNEIVDFLVGEIKITTPASLKNCLHNFFWNNLIH